MIKKIPSFFKVYSLEVPSPIAMTEVNPNHALRIGANGIGPRAAIALGSNLGESQKILEAALDLLCQTPDIQLVACSSWYQTVAVGPPQPDYINGCALLDVSLSPETLMNQLLEIETQFGRVRQQPWGPRTLDLDLLLYDDRVLALPGLQIPHPRMRERAFVLIPLAEICPDWIDPVSHRSIAQLVKTVDWTGVRRVSAPNPSQDFYP